MPLPRRILRLYLLLWLPVCAALPPELAEICRTHPGQNPKGWSFTQVTAAGDRTLVERFDAGQPDFNRWSLLAENDRAPSEEQAREYREKFTRRSRGGTAPGIAGQLELGSAELVSEDDLRAAYRFHLKAPESGDKTAAHLRATLTFHKPSRTIEVFELSSIEPFSPVFGVRIQELRTTIYYHLPAKDRPALLDRITTRTRGRAFFKSLDADMLVTYRDYAWAGRKPPALAQPAAPP